MPLTASLRDAAPAGQIPDAYPTRLHQCQKRKPAIGAKRQQAVIETGRLARQHAGDFTGNSVQKPDAFGAGHRDVFPATAERRYCAGHAPRTRDESSGFPTALVRRRD